MLVWLTAVWVGLWGDLSVANVLGGLLLAVVVLRLLPMPPPEGPGRPSLSGGLYFLGVFLVALVQASLQVLVLVLRPGRSLHQAVLAVPVHGGGDRLLTLVANSISLTPGTLTLEVDRDRGVLYVHALDVGPDAQRLDAVRADIARLEAASRRALGVPA